MKETDMTQACEYCGEDTDARYCMHQEAGVWSERVDGSPAEFGDLYCCYSCCGLLEQESEFEANRRRMDALQRREEYVDESDRDWDR